MLAKRVNDRLLCSLSEFEARLLKDMLGQISFNGIPYGDFTKAATIQMCDVLGDCGVYFTGGTFSGKLAANGGASNLIMEAINEEGWHTQGVPVEDDE